jgi:hypothetical protein
MTDIFKIIEVAEKDGSGKKGAAIGIDIKIADQATCCPVSRICHRYDDLVTEVGAIQNELKQILEKAKAFFGRTSPGGGLEITPEMSTEEIWSALSGIGEESLFITSFNNLDDAMRREVAEHVFTRCNIFSGRPAFFCARYNNASGYIE